MEEMMSDGFDSFGEAIPNQTTTTARFPLKTVSYHPRTSEATGR
jgi:hypothetical protein